MDFSQHIEHTCLGPTLTIREIDQCVQDARQHNFLVVSVPPFWVKRARREIGTDRTLLATAVGFPFGYNMTETKLDEIRRALDNGADEIDVVWNVSSFKAGNPWTKIEIAKCARLTHDSQKILRVTIETAYLSDVEITEACKLCSDAGTDMLNTSTGFAPFGATAEHIKLMRAAVPLTIGIQASGGIDTYAQALHLIQAGAERIGTASAVNIIQSQPQPFPPHHE